MSVAGARPGDLRRAAKVRNRSTIHLRLTHEVRTGRKPLARFLAMARLQPKRRRRFGSSHATRRMEILSWSRLPRQARRASQRWCDQASSVSAAGRGLRLSSESIVGLLPGLTLPGLLAIGSLQIVELAIPRHEPQLALLQLLLGRRKVRLELYDLLGSVSPEGFDLLLIIRVCLTVSLL
eukprot:scaffold7339_cov249-Pinguiococcus_pyrenoidosus.AAC.22